MSDKLAEPQAPEALGHQDAVVVRPRLDVILDTSFLMEDPAELLDQLKKEALLSVVDLRVVLPVQVQVEIARHFRNTDKSEAARKARGWVVWLLKEMADNLELEVNLETDGPPPGWVNEVGPLGPDSPVDRGIIVEALRRCASGQSVGILTRDGGIAIAMRRFAVTKRANILDAHEVSVWAVSVPRVFQTGPSEQAMRLAQIAEARGDFQVARSLNARAVVLAATEAEDIRLSDEARATRLVEEAEAAAVRAREEAEAAALRERDEAIRIRKERAVRTRKFYIKVTLILAAVLLFAAVFALIVIYIQEILAVLAMLLVGAFVVSIVAWLMSK